jgi:hypothetical protein
VKARACTCMRAMNACTHIHTHTQTHTHTHTHVPNSACVVVRHYALARPDSATMILPPSPYPRDPFPPDGTTVCQHVVDRSKGPISSWGAGRRVGPDKRLNTHTASQILGGGAAARPMGESVSWGGGGSRASEEQGERTLADGDIQASAWGHKNSSCVARFVYMAISVSLNP